MSTFSVTQNSDSPPPQLVKDGVDPPQIHIAPPTSNTAFQLPQGWLVEVRPRGPNSSGPPSDKYYYEPGTGRKFRSLLSVKRYLDGEEEMSSRKKKSACQVLRPHELEETDHTRLGYIVPTSLQLESSFILPDGWTVEMVPRKCGLKSDRFFIDLVTGRKFRSLPEVQRYLGGQKYSRSKCDLLTISNHAKGPRSPTPRKRRTSVEMLNDALFDLSNPPEKVNWVFSGDGSDKWSPLLEECMLPDHVKEQWAETFFLGMNGWKQQVPQLT